MSNEEILKLATDVYGCLNQSDMMIEEAAELIQAINKMKRLGGLNKFDFRKPNEHDSEKYCLAYHGLCGEIADVKILVRQMESMVDQETVDLIEQRKIDRLHERLMAI